MLEPRGSPVFLGRLLTIHYRAVVSIFLLVLFAEQKDSPCADPGAANYG
jgi:hypothetical protein